MKARSGSPGPARAYRPLCLGHRVRARQRERAGRLAGAPRSRLQRGEQGGESRVYIFQQCYDGGGF